MDPLAFMNAGGEMGALIRAHDWARSPLGPPAQWPQSLKTALRTALTTRHPMFIFWGPEHRCFYNDGYRPSLGPEKHPAILGAPGRPMFDELWDIVGPQIELVMRGEGATWHENHLVPSYRNGRLDEVYWTYSYGPIDDETAPNGVGGVLVVCTETTATVKNEAALKRLTAELERRVDEALAERKLLADIVGASDAFVQVIDRHLRWIAINEAALREAERRYGRRPQVGEAMLPLLDAMPGDRAALEAGWRRALAGEGFMQVQELGDPARGRRTYEMRFNPLRDKDGRLIGAYQFAYDVSERLQAQQRLAETENQLMQAQKMETLGQLTGGVAHDFNNLLTPVMAALDFARLELADDTEAHELVGVGLQAADRARTLVQRLLSFARKQHLAPRDVDVVLAVDNVVEMAGRSLGRGIALTIDIADGLPCARVDPDQLVLALLNLVVNARDAIAPPGRLRIHAVAVDAADHGGLGPGRYVRIDVSDDGAGMDAATLRRAAEPFFTTKETGRGTGLGLSAVQGLAAQSGGGFRLRSEPGEGTTASLWLPVPVDAADAADAVERVEASAPGAAQSDAADLHVLLVDDDDLVRLGAAAMLRHAGYRVDAASSGAAALELLERVPRVDVLVTDQVMPGMSGLELVAQARRTRPDLPALLISGYADPEAGEDADMARLAKPFRPADLVSAVAGLARGAAPGDAA